MSSPRDEFALLLAAPDPTEAELARELLASAGIPSILHGQDRDLAELGAAIHAGVARPDLFVPKSAYERARALLEDAWDEESLTDEVALGAPRQDAAAPRKNRSALPWFLFAALLGFGLLLTWLRLFGSRSP